MADNKHYIEQQQKQGTILISEDVITTIIENAVKEVDGIVSLSARPEADIADKVGKRGWNKGIKITIEDNNTMLIDCNVNISYGQSVVNIAEAVQAAVRNALESVTGVNTAAVNVNVCGIVRQ